MNNKTQITELIGVYDADATIMGELSYWLGARLGVRHCSLCDITHSLFRRRSEWLEVTNTIESDLGISFKFYHRNDQPDEICTVIAGAYPAVVARYGNKELHLFMNEGDISSCGKSPTAFQQAIYKKLEL